MIWKSLQKDQARRRDLARRLALKPPTRRVEPLEPRRMMAGDVAEPIRVGVVFLETDYLESENDTGGDSRGDRFILSFTGGAADTELTELRIRTDKDGDGISVGDPIFDTAEGGRGKGGSHDFEIVRLFTSDGRSAQVNATVEDGGQELVLRLENFRSGDRLEFTLDVDEVLRNSLDLDIFNDRLDVITSGQEFQDSILEATFEAPHFQSASTDALFINDFGDPGSRFGLNLPPDAGPTVDSRPNRSAAAVGSAIQTPSPIDISGTVFVDDNLDLVRQSNEEVLANVELTLFRLEDDGRYVSTGFNATTDGNGEYRFDRSLQLPPGTYRIVETQPNGFLSVGAVTGQVVGGPDGDLQSGDIENADIITGIEFVSGDTSGINFDFAEARPASIAGNVFEDIDQDGQFDASENGIAGVTIRLVPINTIAPQSILTTTTAADGSYSFGNLSPGTYEVIEVNQPANFTDGIDTAGTVDGQTRGVANNPGDSISAISLLSGDDGVEFNFGELPLGSISGFVYLAAPGEDCDGEFGSHASPIAGALITLIDSVGSTVATTTTGFDGSYSFLGVATGEYTIREQTPEGLIDGGSHVGQIGNVTVGRSTGPSTISSVLLPPGGFATQYNFCEAAPASVSGFVFVDDSNDGIRDAGEDPIAGVTVTLIDATTGLQVDQTTTDASGRYEFESVLPGDYRIVETQPQGLLDGLDSIGTVDGTANGSVVENDQLALTLLQGQTGVEYNFGELRSASLSGRVHLDSNGDCLFDPGEELLSGVMVSLLGPGDVIVATTTTNALGQYQFDNIPPGTYTIVEGAVPGTFDGDASIGSAGGIRDNANRISEITLTSGQVAVEYNFCEQPPAEISGTVFADRDGDCLRHEDEPGLFGVTVELYNDAGILVASTTTDADGMYRFTNLPGGSYTLREIQPIGFLQGSQRAGSGGGDDSVDDVISSISIGFGDRFTNYNFCEIEPAAISGSVHVGSNGDCNGQSNDAAIAGVTITLRDDAGNLVAITTTDANGAYEFVGLRPGQYTITETQPDGFFQGGQSVGTGNGFVIGEDQLGVELFAGEILVNYNFCELPPGSIAGSVFLDTNTNRIFDDSEEPIAGVIVELLDDDGNIISSTRTQVDGSYQFDNLAPGEYQIRETQPDGLFQGGQVVGDLGGVVLGDDLIGGIVLLGGENGIRYDFPEVPPALISGFVFQDGNAIISADPIAPEDLRQFRDGLRTEDDSPLAGVTLELRNILGLPFASSSALPGIYTGEFITTVTDANGFYEFPGLRPGTYHVYQVQPDGLTDGLDTPGTGGGLAINRADQNSQEGQIVIQTLSSSVLTDPRDDAILNVSLAPGSASIENNFSEIAIEAPPIEPPADPPISQIDNPESPILPARTPLETFPGAIRLISFAQPIAPTTPPRYFDEWAVSWHLSVINGGYPNGDNTDELALRSGSVRAAGFEIEGSAVAADGWNDSHNQGAWSIETIDGRIISRGDSMMLGHEDAIALSGDFDGDGVDEAVIFVNGDWYVDFDSDGIWDRGDLWIRLGNKLDRPVVGDWDGDGKDDVGIFGRQWERDPARIKQDPGLPDPANQRRRNVQADTTVAEARGSEAQDERWLRRGNDQTIQADAVDHVFQYGEQPDVPISGDWNGDGIDQIGIFRRGQWTLDGDGDGRFSQNDIRVDFGQAGDEPIVGDFNGDGVDEIGVVRGNTWIIDTDGDGRITGNDLQVEVPRQGGDSDQPIVGDFDGDGIDDVGYYRRAS